MYSLVQVRFSLSVVFVFSLIKSLLLMCRYFFVLKFVILHEFEETRCFNQCSR